MGPFYESRKEREGQLVVESVDEGGIRFIGFAESQAEVDADAPYRDGVYVVLGRVVGGNVVDERGRALGPVEVIVPANWRS